MIKMQFIKIMSREMPNQQPQRTGTRRVARDANRCHTGGHAGDPRACDRTVQIRSREHEQSGSVPSPDAIGRSHVNAMNGPDPLPI